MVYNIFISVASQQVDAEGETSDLTFVTEGRYYEKAGYKYVTYKETEVTGLEGTTTCLKLGSGEVMVIRMGSIEAKQVFAVGSIHHSSYVTPYGTFELTVSPWIVEEQVHEGEGYVRLEYDLEIAGEAISRNSMLIKVNKRE
jgi:uncharacterized beta-barrel protein YwiB (DUF1934 family)